MFQIKWFLSFQSQIQMSPGSKQMEAELNWRVPYERDNCDSAPNHGCHGECGTSIAPFSGFSRAVENWIFFNFFFFKDFIYLFFRDGRRGGERERERDINVWLLGAMACNLGMCPDWESNLQCLVRSPH
ncbi:hypothetical protein HJG60_009791 [Phyllostomus discolor]|uniref:Uncharacterized protein n=1 Tax=Phyllostomus discolor TaxID=89673 RepID=A0A834ET04_9CHIR|nr:hypothetical protein HJG60_009791 [Phyllostomus discolor]